MVSSSDWIKCLLVLWGIPSLGKVAAKDLLITLVVILSVAQPSWRCPVIHINSKDIPIYTDSSGTTEESYRSMECDPDIHHIPSHESTSSDHTALSRNGCIFHDLRRDLDKISNDWQLKLLWNLGSWHNKFYDPEFSKFYFNLIYYFYRKLGPRTLLV